MPKRKLRTNGVLWIVVGLATLAVGERVLSHAAYAVAGGRIQATNEELAQLQASLPDVQVVSRAFKLVAKVARPGVVHIRVARGERPAGADEEEVDRLREQFKDMIPQEQLEHWLRRMPPGSASGIILDAEGHILTNNHVVDGRDEISVVLWDDREYKATVVGLDRKTDLAVVKIEAPDLRPLAFGDSDALEVGDWVLAIGSPFGLTQTVTHGIVSAKGRTRVAGVDITYQDFIQTDAAINPGNSGGPLLNLRGEVVGVNTAIATHGDGVNAGIAFTIPSNMAMKVAKQLRTSGTVTRGYLGILPVPLSAADPELFGLPGTGGVLVDLVMADSPAKHGGLQVEDVIVAVNDTPVTGLEQFRQLVADLRPDEGAHLHVVRDRKETELTVRLGVQPERNQPPDVESTLNSRPVSRLGLGVRTLRLGGLRTVGFRHYDATTRGVGVARLDVEGEGAPDIQPGEVVVACNGQPVKSVYDLFEALKDVPKDEKVKLEILEPVGDRRIVTVSPRK